MDEELQPQTQDVNVGESAPTTETSNDSQVPDFNEIFGVDPASTYDEEGNIVSQEQTPPPAETTEETPPAEQTPPVEPEQPTDTEKKVQTPEENAKFAEQRRQQQEAERQQRLQEEADRIAEQKLSNSYEAQVARDLERIYGMPIDQIAKQLEQARLQQQAEQQGVPVEFVQQQQQVQEQLQALEQRATQAEFNQWFTQKNAEKAEILQKYPMLDEADVNQSIQALLTDLRNKDLPLEQAVMANHGTKIVDGIRNAERQNALAEVSGRERGPLSPQGSKPNQDGPVLTPEQKSMAKKMGIAEKDYLLWMDKETM